MTPLFGLIGYPLSHSFSPAYFRKKFAASGIDAHYEAFPLEGINMLPDLLRSHPNLEGLNVTTPYKGSVIAYLHETDAIAHEIGAVNCISIKSGHITGYNTDAAGFEQSLNPLLQPQHTQALVLGNGGASRAVVYVLRQLGITFQQVSRDKDAGGLTYDEITHDIIETHTIIINTTTLGMYPEINAAPPIPYEHIGPQHLLYDLIYNPEETEFLAQGRSRGAVTKNGFEMLQLQAEASWDIWTGNK